MKKKIRIAISSNQILLILSLFLLISPCYGYATELEILMNLKAAMVGPKGSGLEDWTNGDVCSFSGVTCDAESRAVVALNLTNVPLHGHLPPEIGLLGNLVNLTVASGNLTGKLPSEIGKLTALKLLNISNNIFAGRFPGEISLGATQLEVIDTYNNNFTGPLPAELAHLKSLRYLHLGGNYFSGAIPDSFSSIANLEYLGLNGNSLTGRFPASMAKLEKLREMYVGYDNNYDGGIPPELGFLPSLELLDMASCNLTGEIPKSLSNLKRLHSLFLQINRLSGQIPSELSGLVSLMSLDLSINELTGEIPESFSALTNLTLINLFRNNFYGEIPAFVGELPNLEVFQVWENNFTMYLPENLGRNGKLKDLDVTNNHLTGLIPRDLCKGGKLKTLILMQNSFFGPIPEELGECKSLTKIRIMKNYFNGSIPAGIFRLPNVTMIELSDNYFTGELPSEISGDSLGILALSNNWITGKISPAIGKLVNLQTLSMEMNRFRGEIPEEIFGLQLLSKINISFNNLTGEIPASLPRCQTLTAVDLSCNALIGEIPGGIADLHDLSILNLSRNLLGGEIPGVIRSMTSLTTLDLSFNNFHGRVPHGGQFMVFNDTSFVGNHDLCLPRHSSACLSVSSRPRNGLMSTSSKLSIAIISAVTLLIFVALTLYRLRKKKLLNAKTWRLTAFQRLDFRAEDVIECVRDENIIGKGGAGVVYRGSMPDGTDVAIKRLETRGSSVRRGERQSDHGFTAEIQTLGQIKHRNIVRLLGYVSNKETNLLLYEYMTNGSLGEMLHGSKGGKLEWDTRYKVAVEAAKGLCYLHHDCSPPILHRDVKSNNILLDSEMEAHVADFGLAKFLRDSGTSECMSSIAGSYGYIAPEYAYTLKVDEKSDVYSFGVVLLELIAGRRPVGDFGEGVDIVRWVRKTKSELSQPPSDAASVLAVVDHRLNGYQLTSVIHLFKLAMMCVEDESCARPTMREVVHMLAHPPSSTPTPTRHFD